MKISWQRLLIENNNKETLKQIYFNPGAAGQIE